jgi:adenylyltransferase/sulfurtransferase
VIGTLQATETIKLILDCGRSLCGRLLLFDALELRFRELALRRDPACPVCGDEPTIRELVDLQPVCAAEARAGPSGLDIDVEALGPRLARESPPFLLDVRSPQEWAICRLPGAVLIPVEQLETRLDEVEREREIVVYCHSGMRSAMAAKLLRGQGYDRVRNLAGGIDAWAERIDPKMPRY